MKKNILIGMISIILSIESFGYVFTSSGITSSEVPLDSSLSGDISSIVGGLGSSIGGADISSFNQSLGWIAAASSSPTSGIIPLLYSFFSFFPLTIGTIVEGLGSGLSGIGTIGGESSLSSIEPIEKSFLSGSSGIDVSLIGNSIEPISGSSNGINSLGNLSNFIIDIPTSSVGGSLGFIPAGSSSIPLSSADGLGSLTSIGIDSIESLGSIGSIGTDSIFDSINILGSLGSNGINSIGNIINIIGNIIESPGSFSGSLGPVASIDAFANNIWNFLNSSLGSLSNIFSLGSIGAELPLNGVTSSLVSSEVPSIVSIPSGSGIGTTSVDYIGSSSGITASLTPAATSISGLTGSLPITASLGGLLGGSSLFPVSNFPSATSSAGGIASSITPSLGVPFLGLFALIGSLFTPDRGNKNPPPQDPMSNMIDDCIANGGCNELID